jgi:hypothetical protein
MQQRGGRKRKKRTPIKKTAMRIRWENEEKRKLTSRQTSRGKVEDGDGGSVLVLGKEREGVEGERSKWMDSIQSSEWPQDQSVATPKGALKQKSPANCHKGTQAGGC